MPTYPLLGTVIPSYYNEEAKKYPGAKQEYQDFGADYISLADTPVRRWTINYSGTNCLIAAEAALFVTLADAVKYNDQEGSLLGMDFTPRGESLIANVHFDEGGFTIRRGPKAHIYFVECKLIKRP